MNLYNKIIAGFQAGRVLPPPPAVTSYLELKQQNEELLQKYTDLQYIADDLEKERDAAWAETRLLRAERCCRCGCSADERQVEDVQILFGDHNRTWRPLCRKCQDEFKLMFREWVEGWRPVPKRPKPHTIGASKVFGRGK